MLEQDTPLTFFSFGHLGALWAPKLAPKSPKLPKSPFGAVSRSGVSELVEQYETSVEQVRAHPG